MEETWSSVARDVAASFGTTLEAMFLAFARVFPIVLLVPAIGLKGFQTTIRAAFALVLALAIAPAFRSAGSAPLTALSILEAVLSGIPVAIAASVPLWIVMNVGAYADLLRGSTEPVASPFADTRQTQLSTLFGLLGSAWFLSMGGVSITAGLLLEPLPPEPLLRIVGSLANGVAIATVIAGPLLGASVLLEVATALIAKHASPANIQGLLTPLRNVALLAVLAFGLHEMESVLSSVFLNARP